MYKPAEWVQLQIQDLHGNWLEEIKARVKSGNLIMIPIPTLEKAARRGGVSDRVERVKRDGKEGKCREYHCRAAFNRGIIGSQIRVDGAVRTWNKNVKVYGGMGEFV